MDKKQNYSRQGSNKALVSEQRKSSDFSKPLPRNGKRRENPNSNNFKNDYNQRNYNVAPKIRSYVDKRPKPRSYTAVLPINVSPTSSGLISDNSAIKDGDNDDIEIELNSIYAQGSKKQNLNHLLNFHYNTWENDRGGFNVFGRNGNNRNYTKKHKYNKEQFLQANFQFVIKSSAEPRIDASCPDTLVEWSLIEQINIQTTEEPQCPICLYPPISAKLTRCGHVYCWPCILHYLALSDKTWRKCPICYEAIHLADLKSTSIVQQTNFKVGDFVTLQLMKRKKGSMFIEKVSTNIEDMIARPKYLPHLTDSNELKRFSKFLLADPNEILTILDKEHNELIFGEDLNCPESVFIQQALDLLKERKNLIAQELDQSTTDIKINNSEKLKISINETDIKAIEEPNQTKQSGNVEGNIEDIELINKDMLPKNSVVNGAIQKDKYYYFYQSVDGQNIFLHPINVKMLQAMYGSLDRGPALIKSKILQKESHSMDEEHRKKFTCLGHLPLTCQFEIVEVQFQPPMISDEILKMFKDDIIMRQKNRQRRAREEKKREREINEINERQMGKIIARSANIDIQSSQQFPTCGFEDSLSGNSFDQSASSLAYASELADSPPITYTRNSFASFANILSSPKKELWPTLETTSHNSSTSTNELTWAKAMSSPMPIKTTTPPGQLNRITDTESNNDLTEDAIHITRNNLSDVLAEAFEKKKKCENQTTEKTDVPNGNNKKNKKNKKTLLFSTGMSFGAK